MYQRLPSGKIGKAPKPPRQKQGESQAFWLICGIILFILILNDICHIFTGEGLWYQIK